MLQAQAHILNLLMSHCWLVFMTSKQVTYFVSTLFRTSMYWPFSQLLSCTLLPSFLANRLLSTKEAVEVFLRAAILQQVAHKSQTGYYTCWWWGHKNSACFRLLLKCVNHTPMHKVICCLSLLTENMGTLSSTTNLSFLDIGGNVPLCINVGELLSLKTRFKYM